MRQNSPLHPSILGIIVVLMSCLQGCWLNIPDEIQPVSNFDLHRYMGRWYEIARLNHRFERGIQQVTAIYSLQKDETVRVDHVGFDRTGKRKVLVGKAKLVSDKQIGHLKIAFIKFSLIGHIYGSYVVFHLEPDYSVAMVCGESRDYCLILARKPVLEKKELAKYLKIAQENGFEVDKFIYPSPILVTTPLPDWAAPLAN
ncbi:MAG: lipocalin family protein [Bacteroidota bacterium]